MDELTEKSCSHSGGSLLVKWLQISVMKHETLLPLMLILCVPITELIPMCLEVNFEFVVLKHYCSHFETSLHVMLMFCAYK